MSDVLIGSTSTQCLSVEYDNAEDPFPYTTTTVTSYAPEVTVATDYTGHIVTTVTEPSQGGTIAGNSNESLISSRKSYTAIIIGVIVPVVVALILCCLGFCMYRKRRARTRERRRDSFREKMFRRIGRQPIELNAAGAAPLSPMYRTRERPMSGFTYASTHYSTAEEYPTSPSPPSGSGGHYTPASPTPFAVAFGRESDDYARAGTNAPAPRDERQGTAAPHLSMSFPPDHRSNRPPTTENGGNARSAGGERLASTYDPTFSPPTEWDSTPTARNPDEPITAARSGASTDPHTVMRDDHALSRTRSPASTISAPSAYVTAESHLRQPSTVFSASESSVSHQHQPRSPLSPLPPAHQRPFSTTSTHAPLSRPGSILRRFSQALGRSFARSGEPDAESNRNSVNMRTTPRAGVVHDHTLSDEQNPGYFRGMNHFNLGIPLNYRPSASAASPADATRLSRQSQNLQGQTIADESSTGLRSMTRAANGRMDDLAFSSYTQPTRDRVLSTAAPTTTPEHRPDVDTDINNNNNPRQVDEEDEKEKIIEAFDGSTIEGSMRAWSVGHGTMASQGTFNSPLDADGNMDGSGLARSGSQPSSRRSRRSVSHERAGHLVRYLSTFGLISAISHLGLLLRRLTRQFHALHLLHTRNRPSSLVPCPSSVHPRPLFNRGCTIVTD